MRGSGVVVVLALAAAVAPSAAQTVTAGDISIRLTGRIQIQFNSTSVGRADLEGADIPTTVFETRRVRLGAHLTFRDWIEGYVEPDFAGGHVQLRQGWVNLGFDPAFELRIGQFKKPFGLIELTSAVVVPAIERGLRIRGLDDAYALAQRTRGLPVLDEFGGDLVLGEEQALLEAFRYQGMDLGAAAHGRLGRMSYEVGVFNGASANTAEDNSAKAVAGRVSWTVPAARPLAISAGASYNSTGGADGSAFEVDVEWGELREPGVHVLAEAVTGRNQGAEQTFVAAQGIVTWFAPLSGHRIEGIEPLGRISWADPNTSIDGDVGLLLTPGLNLYFMGRNRLMFNWDVFVPRDDRFDTEYALRAQAQLYF